MYALVNTGTRAGIETCVPKLTWSATAI